MVSGDYRGFVMIWEVEDVKEELVSLERRLKTLPKDRCMSAFFPLLPNTIFDTLSQSGPGKRRAKVYFS